MILLLLTLACESGRGELTAPLVIEASPSPAAGLLSASFTLLQLQLHAPAGQARWSPPQLIPTAHAHPGHDLDGGAAGEWVGELPIDALGVELVAGELLAFEGPIATAGLRFRSVQLLGERQGEDETLPFRFEYTDELVIEGLPIDANLDATSPPSAFRLRVDPAVWLGWVQLDDLDGDGDIDADDGVNLNTFHFGVASNSAWAVSVGPASR